MERDSKGKPIPVEERVPEDRTKVHRAASKKRAKKKRIEFLLVPFASSRALRNSRFPCYNSHGMGPAPKTIPEAVQWVVAFIRQDRMADAHALVGSDSSETEGEKA